MAADQNHPGGVSHAPVFVTTHWSIVLTAVRTDTTRAQAALEHLCRIYWYPIYHFVRRQGYSVEDAQDLTQEFFARLLEKNWIANADQSRGRFRSFLLLVLKRFLAAEWRRANVQKRAGDRHWLPLDTAETRYIGEPADNHTPEQAFEKQWALTLLETALRQLRSEYEQHGKVRARLFEILKPCLMGARESQPYSTLAATLGISEGAVKVAVHRLRERFREQLKAEIAHTVALPEDVEAELRHLLRVLSRN